jgi:hypothetical protein
MARSPTVGSRPPVVELRLEREAKLAELLDGAAGWRLEASGVFAKDGSRTSPTIPAPIGSSR